MNLIGRAGCVSLLALSMGCGGGPKMANVSGVVTLEGEPVPNVVVRFQPLPPEGESFATGKAAFGEAGADGKFRLSTYGEYDGAVVGVHRVTVSSLDSSPLPGTAPPDFRVEVAPGSNDLEIALSPAATNVPGFSDDAAR
ncbi:hypothetical protein MalM25_23080 [Planctomycetes bacterium MalM25]|nr:hypothetical protein MalM25_23080 [Planctomycetes bacterium MalM25]